MVFGLGRKSKKDQAGEPEESSAAAESEDTAGKGSQDTGRRANGPFDVSEVSSRDGYVDLGALLIAPSEGLQLRLEVEEATQRVVAVTMDLNGSSLQLQAFAAPKTEGLWDEIRGQIGQSVGSQGGQVEEVQGAFGTELVAKLPAGAPDGSQGYRVARFIGVDGPRWFLRGVLGGEAAMEREAAAPLEDLFRRIVVIRGDSPMPPRDLLQLRLPKDASAAPPPGASEFKEPEVKEPEFKGPERGPEITQIG
jgi:gas vesicle protein